MLETFEFDRSTAGVPEPLSYHMVATSETVSFIVVNWNGARLLKDCLESLFAQTYPDREVILVDNGSADESVRFVKENFPQVILVELSGNHGFTGGNAAGLRIARGRFVALINNDARVESDWAERALQSMLADPNVGVCASKLIIDGTNRIDSAGDGVTTAGVGFNRGHWTDPKRYNSFGLVFAACAAGCLYRRKMIDEVGFMDNDFFLYDEDVDLSFRAQLAGWKCVYVPDAVAYHKANATAGRLSDTHVYYHTRNLEFVWIKNMPTVLMLRYAHQKLIQEIGSFAYLCMRHGKWRPFFRAKRDALRMLPIMWKKRREIQKRRRVTAQYISNQLTSMFDLEILRQKLHQFIRG